jgi:hypothetical protein
MTLHCSLIRPNTRMTPIGSPTKVGDGPLTQRFLKPVICLGSFIHPKHGWKLDVDENRLNTYVKNFAAMKSNGVPVKLTKDHKRTSDAVVGDAIELTREGDWLNAIVEVSGEKNIELCETNKDVSIEVDEGMVDGKGNRYGECITAISVVRNPIVPGQTGFKRIAAGHDDDDGERPLYLFSTGEPDMKPIFAAIASLAAVVGLSNIKASGLNEDNAADALGNIQQKFTAQGEEIQDLTRKLSLAEEEHEPDTKYLSLAGKSMEKEIDAGLKGILSDAGIKALKTELIGDLSKKQFSKLLLSVDSEEDGIAIVENIVKIIRDNPGVARGGKTDPQKVKELSRDDGDGDDANKPLTAERVEELLQTTPAGQAVIEHARRK